MNRHNQVPHLTQDTNEKVTNSQLDTTNESQEVSPDYNSFLKGKMYGACQHQNRIVKAIMIITHSIHLLHNCMGN